MLPLFLLFLFFKKGNSYVPHQSLLSFTYFSGKTLPVSVIQANDIVDNVIPHPCSESLSRTNKLHSNSQNNNEYDDNNANLEDKMKAASMEELEAARKFAQECDAEWFEKYIAEDDNLDNFKEMSTYNSFDEDNKQKYEKQQSYTQRATSSRYQSPEQFEETNVSSSPSPGNYNDIEILVYELGYSEEDVFSLSPETIDILIEKRIPRPKGVIPSDWKRWQSPPPRPQQETRKRYSYDPKSLRNGDDPRVSNGRIDNSMVLRDRQREFMDDDEELLALPSIDEFKTMLRRETEWRLGLTGGWASDLVRSENQMRLAIYNAFMKSVEETNQEPGPTTPGAVWDRASMRWILEDERLQDPFYKQPYEERRNNNYPYERRDIGMLPSEKRSERFRFEEFEENSYLSRSDRYRNNEPQRNSFSSYDYQREQSLKNEVLSDIDQQLNSRKRTESNEGRGGEQKQKEDLRPYKNDLVNKPTSEERQTHPSQSANKDGNYQSSRDYKDYDEDFSDFV